MMPVDELIAKLRILVTDPSREDEVEEVKGELLALALGAEGGRVRSQLESLLRGEVLEVRWEIEEVLEDATPAAPAEQQPAPEPEPEDNPDELVMVYDDPRGLVLHRTRDGNRWFATQVDPNTGQPATFELPPHQVPDIKQQLAGSPYWVLGTGA